MYKPNKKGSQANEYFSLAIASQMADGDAAEGICCLRKSVTRKTRTICWDIVSFFFVPPISKANIRKQIMCSLIVVFPAIRWKI